MVFVTIRQQVGQSNSQIWRVTCWPGGHLIRRMGTENKVLRLFVTTIGPKPCTPGR